MPNLKAAVVDIARRVIRRLDAEAPLRHFRLTPMRTVVARTPTTDGYFAEIARLHRRGPSFTVWLDRYSGHKKPYVWYGFSSASLGPIARLRLLAPAAGFRRPPDVRTRRHLAGGGHTRYKSPLAAHEFDRLAEDRFAGDAEFYLGVFHPDPWPFSSRALSDLSGQLATFLGRFDRAIGDSWGVQGPALRAWGTADPQVERAAVRQVTTWLRRQGYSVRSREDQICGYDLFATSDSDELHVEVKGTATSVQACYLSANEWRVAQADPRWRLVLVTRATERPRLHVFTPSQVRRTFVFSPLEWRLVEKGTSGRTKS